MGEMHNILLSAIVILCLISNLSKPYWIQIKVSQKGRREWFLIATLSLTRVNNHD